MQCKYDVILSVKYDVILSVKRLKQSYGNFKSRPHTNLALLPSSIRALISANDVTANFDSPST